MRQYRLGLRVHVIKIVDRFQLCKSSVMLQSAREHRRVLVDCLRVLPLQSVKIRQFHITVCLRGARTIDRSNSARASSFRNNMAKLKCAVASSGRIFRY